MDYVELITQIADNFALLISLIFLYSLIHRRLQRAAPTAYQFVVGLLFGGMGIAAMLTPITLQPDLIFDGRFLSIALPALFTGALPAALSTLIILGYRVAVGGSGMLSAVGATLTCLLGSVLLARTMKRQPVHWPIWWFALLGAALALNMWAWILTLPGGIGLSVLRIIALPLLLGYSLGTLFVGGLLSREHRILLNEDQLAANERRYRLLFEGSIDPIFITDEDGTIIDSNQAGEQLLSFSRYELQQMSIGDLYVNHAVWESLYEKLLIVGTVHGQQAQLRRKNGDVIDCMISSSLQKTANGDALQFQNVVHDISEQKRAESELDKYREHLEELVMQRTNELQEANVMLQQLSDLKDEFVSNVSHELRSPITNLKLHLELLEMRDDKRERYMATLKRETYRLEALVEDLLLISRLDHEGNVLQLADVEINELIRPMLIDRMSLIEGNGLTLKTEYSDSAPVARVDPRQIMQVISILLTNAINYTPAGGTITVRTVWDQARAPTCGGIIVRDTGPGIYPEERSRIFERFFRGRAALDTGTAGTGLGLALAHEIVARHDGRIEVASREQGAEFSVWLPCAPSSIQRLASS